MFVVKQTLVRYLQVTFTGDNTLLKKLYKICTNDYDNNKYLAVKYIRFFTKHI